MRRVLLTVVALCVLAGTGLAQDAKKKRPEKKRPGGGGELAAMAAQLIAKFDRNGDRSLNVEELTAALTAMRQRFAPGDGAGKKKPGGDFRKKRPGGLDKKKGFDKKKGVEKKKGFDKKKQERPDGEGGIDKRKKKDGE